MATWTSPHANMGGFTAKSVTDGVSIYGIHTGGTIRRYEPLNGDAGSTISNATVASPEALLWFNGHLYCTQEQGSGPSEVYRYEGGTLWTKVESITNTTIRADPIVLAISPTLTDPIITGFGTIGASKNYMILTVEINSLIPTTTYSYFRYTTDGIHWTTGPVIANADAFDIPEFHDNALGIFGVLTVSAVAKYYEFNEVTTALEFRANRPASFNLRVNGNNYIWQHKVAPDTTQYSTDTITWTTPSAIPRIIPSNSPNPVGWEFVSGSPNDLLMKLWDPVAKQWEAGSESILTSVLAMSASNLIRIEDGTVFMFVFEGAGGDWLVRDEPLGGQGQPDEEDPYTEGQFYYGTGELVKRADTPISGTNLNGMALLGRSLLIGSSIANNVIVAYGTDADNYESWTDYTGSLSKSAPIKAFSATPWGTSEDLEGSEDPEEGFQGGTGGQCS